MCRSLLFLVCPLALAITIGLGGCKSEEKTNEQTAPAKTQSKTGAEAPHADHIPGVQSDPSLAPPDFDAELAKLSSADRAAAEKALAELSPEDQAKVKKQVFCPVTGHLLGSMGAPCQVTHKGQSAFLCCKGCEEQFNADPEKYLAAIPK